MYFALFFAGVGLAFSTYTWLRVRRITSAHAPDGRTTIIDGFPLHYHEFPPGHEELDRPTLVFLHGASGNAYDTMLAFKDALVGRHRLLFIDRPGLGFSQRHLRHHSTPDGQAKLIAGLLEALEIKNAIVVGHSLGAATAADLGLLAPGRVKGLCFLAPATHPWPGGVNWYYSVAALPVVGWLFCWTITLPVAERLAPKAIANVFQPDKAPGNYADAIRLPLLFLPDVFRSNAKDIASLKDHVIGQAPNYHKMQQPALVVTGTQDSVVWPSIHSEGLFRDLPNAELLVLDKAGHMPHHTHTSRIAAAMDRLVARVTALGKAPAPQARAVGDLESAQ